MEQTKEKQIFEQMPVPEAVFTLAVPTVISQLIVLVYNLADTWFIGKTGDTLQVAAVTVSYPVFMLLSAFANLFGIGGGSLISRLLGSGKEEEAGKVGTFALWASGTVILFYSLSVWIFGGQMLSALGSSGQTLFFARQYLFWTVVIGGLPTVLNLVLANIVRAQGKAKVASIGMSVGGVLNIILDPVFIFGLHMNVAGAALATCLFLANLMWPMYGLMLVQPFMEFFGSMIALGMYRKQQGTGLTYRHRNRFARAVQ